MFYLLINNLNKEHSSWMYFCVFQGEFINVVNFLLYCITPVILDIHKTKSRLHRKTASSWDIAYLKAVCSLKTHPIADFLTRGKVLGNVSSLNIPMHVARNEHFWTPCPKYFLPGKASDFENGHRALVHGQISLNWGWLSEQRKPATNASYFCCSMDIYDSFHLPKV